MTTANDLKSPRGALNSLNRLLNDSRTALSPDAPYSPPAIPPGSPRYTAFPPAPPHLHRESPGNSPPRTAGGSYEVDRSGLAVELMLSATSLRCGESLSAGVSGSMQWSLRISKATHAPWELED